MKRFVSAVALCVSLFLFGLFALSPSTRAQKNLLETLLNLPAPPPPNPLVVNNQRNLPADFYSKNKPPADDIAIADLLAYWQSINSINRSLAYAPDMSERAFERIRGEVEKNPELLPGVINTFPETSEAANFVKNLYDRELSEEKYDPYWREGVKRWLTYNSDYFSDELAELAEKAGDTNEYVTNQEELLALARVDWNKAQPILDKLLSDNNQPISQTLARWAYYKKAVRENNSSDADRYRRELQATVENKTEKPGNRDLAMDALVDGGDFDGRDEWYFTLLEDETLHDLRVNGASYTGLTTLLNHSPSDKYVAKMLELAKSSNQVVRSAAVRNLSTLLDEKNPEVVRALLPWLENPKWAKETNSERRTLIYALREFEMPESVPGLIAVLNEKQSVEVSPQTNMNSAVMNSNMAMTVNTVTGDVYSYRDAAIGALATQKDIRAVAPLRAVLPEVEEWQRGQVVQAILASHGFSIPEQVEALESVAKNYNQPTDAMMNTNSVMVNTITGGIPNGDRSFNQAEIKPLLGMQLVTQTEAEDDLVTALIARIQVLDRSDPSMAYALRKIMQNWNGAAVNRLLLSDLKTDKADIDSVIKLLSLRKELREKQFSEVSDVQTGSQTAIGIGACLLENAGGYDAILESDNQETKTAMFACARLIRAALPIGKVAENLRSPNALLSLAAERYLESEDSPEARRIVLSMHPNEAKILGARTYFAPNDSSDFTINFLDRLFASVDDSFGGQSYYLYYGRPEDFVPTEKRLQKEVKENQELLGVYAYDDNYVRIYKDKAVFSWQTDKARYRERDLRPEEFSNLTSYLAAERVDEFAPFISGCEGECSGKELIMLGRQGGRRVFTLSEPQPKFFAGLETIFEDMRRPPAKLHYWLEKNIAGLEILFDDENLQAEAVWKTGDDFRVLLNNQARRKQIDKEIEQQEQADAEKIQGMGDDTDYEVYQKLEEANRRRREQRAFENYTWYKFAGNALAGTTSQPTNIEFLPKQDGAAVLATERQWKARTATFEIRSDSEGLYKVAGGRMTKIRDGYYDNPVVSANGRWIVAVKYGDEGGQLVRINLQTNKEYVAAFSEHPLIETLAFVPSLNRVLFFGGDYTEGEYEETPDITERAGDFYFLDVETGAVQKAKGEILPIAQQTFRPLQSAGQPDEFWAAIPDADKEETQVGVYNLKTLAFKPILKIPQIEFNSMQMWIDTNKVYFVYQGHLLGLPLPK